MTEFATTTMGDTVAYDRHGDGGPGVVFIAGAGPNRAGDPMTTATARMLADRGVTAVVHDRLGRNESPAEGVLTLERELAAVAAMIDAAGGSAVLVGHSSGCAIAIEAARAGAPVDGLVLWEAPFMKTADDAREWIDEFERRLDAGDRDGAQRQYMRDMPAEFIENAQAAGVWDAIVAAVESLRPDGRALVAVAAEPLQRVLEAVSVPVLAIVGEDTFPGMAQAADAIAAAAPDGASERIAGAHHMWDPDAMVDRLALFLGLD
ncbi:alpha/beta fold hydrolase [Williamsia deligens]|uniref:Alpha/beta fold hydrolase n=1 Tax=Williamsia deligens TaxID=321325 RepID=A0ABW3G8R6_9NOCA|nr:alpha/beta hydrolase [Williamsia deligens]MCP2193212.1 Pimeloyl-ACP methyl ester carboxylesterase [Williamsia deligens]